MEKETFVNLYEAAQDEAMQVFIQLVLHEFYCRGVKVDSIILQSGSERVGIDCILYRKDKE